jgi:hypothetical protein
MDCHSMEEKKGELDLERFGGWDDVWKAPEIWSHVLEQVSLGEMPPAEKKQPSAEERAKLAEWINGVLNSVAEARAGDPGPVVLRRLNNTEYKFTLRDLTGVAELDPAKEFPADSAAGEGFMNTGNALVMSPALLSKYLDAAKRVTEHAVLLPDGFRFSSKTTRRDWSEEILGEIRALYARYTEATGADKVNLQGIVFDTNEGGRLPLGRYLEATVDERESLAAGKFVDIAEKHQLSAKYLRLIWETLSGADESLLLSPIRARWAQAKREDVSVMASEIAQWQKVLWKFSSVGHIGKVGGPKGWMEPVTPLTSRHEVRVKLTNAAPAGAVVLYLVARDVGVGSKGDVVIWEKPRLVKEGQPDILLRDVEGVDGAVFGRLPDGTEMEAGNIAVRAPGVVELRIPAAVASGSEFVASGFLQKEGSVQIEVTTVRPRPGGGLAAGEVITKNDNAPWTSQKRELVHTSPIIVADGSAARARWEKEFSLMRDIFPPALCYTKIVPVDEVVTLTLAHREDDHLARLMLNEQEIARLNQLWAEYEYVSRNALLQVDAFEQLWQYATQDADPSVFEPMRKPIAVRAAEFREFLVESEPRHVEAVVQFASKAYRRPLSTEEEAGLRELYRTLREQELSHEEAFRNTLARIFISTPFLYKLEKPPAGSEPAAVSNHELASRLSYFLWSSMPDARLLEKAAQGDLANEGAKEARRMLGDARVERLATEFATAWLHLYDFETLDEKSPRHFPEFGALQSSMHQEVVQFFSELFRNDGSVLSIFDADFTYLNEALAKHYGIAGVAGPEFRKVEGIKKYSRGGVLTMAATLSKQSGASRTSPILRGNWISEVLLGEKLPKPPKGVPPLPEDEAGEPLSVRQLVEKHTSDPRCANCHARIDGYGFALESFDAIGRARTTDLGGRAIETQAKLFDGTEVDGWNDLRKYLLTQRRNTLLEQFCRKLLGFALGRAVMLSDRPLIAEMRRSLEANDFRFSAAVVTIVNSKQFLEIRGQKQSMEHSTE